MFNVVSCKFQNVPYQNNNDTIEYVIDVRPGFWCKSISR